MIYPPIAELMKKADSRYSLVIATAKRARELVENADALATSDIDKQVSTAIKEIYDDKITIVCPQAKKQTEGEE
ncbi:MAG: DNA-directed RNA polymerase subunit omega [Clostridiaceae bacterium]|nr:DNA-directed RNA polymerase subunit omega [Clostridiaceae bacterium]